MTITEKIKIGMIKKGVKQKDLIKALKSNKGDISNAIAGRDRPVLQKRIYEHLKQL